MNTESKKSIMPIVIILIVVVLGVVGYLFFKGRSNVAGNNNAVTTKIEGKTEAVVMAKAKDYTDAMKFRDYRAEYKLLDNKTRAAINEDDYIKRQEWLDKNTIAGASDIKEVKLGTPTLNGDSAGVRTTLVTSTGEYNDMIKFIYEDGKWHKLFENWDTLSIGKSWDEFVGANQQPAE